MEAFIIITNRINLSIAIKDYFFALSPINNNNIVVITYGLDINNKIEILEEIKKKIIEKEKIENYFIFTDFGDTLTIAKELKKENSKIIFCKGSLIETGLLTYKLINGGAPIESIMMAINKIIKK